MNDVVKQIIDDYKVLYEMERDKRKDYQQRIEKAVEYIKNEGYLEEGYMIPVVEKNPLLNILQNGGDEEC